MKIHHNVIIWGILKNNKLYGAVYIKFTYNDLMKAKVYTV